MQQTYFVSCPLTQCCDMIYDAVVNGSITGELLDCHTIQVPGGQQCVVMVYEKHYLRAGNRLTLTVTIDDITGGTRVHAVGGGGGEGLFQFDWGAVSSFTGVVEEVLRPYLR